MARTKAYSYLRISTDQQLIGDGIRRQLEASKAYAEENDYELVESLQDIGVSAFHSKHAKEGAFATFKSRIDDGTVEPGSVLIVESLDRLSRDHIDVAITQFMELLGKGIKIVTLLDRQEYSTKDIRNNPYQIIGSIVAMIRSQEESATKSKRVRAAWQHKRNNASSRKLTKQCPAWLTLSGDRTEFIIDEGKAETINKIFDLCIGGMGVYSIVRYLNENDYKPIALASSWANSYISKILHNKAVHGQYQPHIKQDGKRIPSGNPITDYYPAIMSEEKFLLAQSALTKRKTGSAGRKGNSFSNLFTNLVICGTCNSPMHYRDKGKPPKGGRYLICSNSLFHNGCTCPIWRYETFEKSFFDYCQEINFNDILRKEEANSQLSTLIKQQTASEAKLDELQKLYETTMNARLDPDLQDKEEQEFLSKRATTTRQERDEVKSLLEKIKEEISSLSTQDARKDQDEFLELYKSSTHNLSPEDVKNVRVKINSLMKRHISKIEINNDTRVEPWEWDNLSDRTGEVLVARGLTTEKAIEDFLSTDYGQRLINSYERTFTIYFSNGQRRKVAPHYKSSLLMVSDKMLARYKA